MGVLYFRWLVTQTQRLCKHRQESGYWRKKNEVTEELSNKTRRKNRKSTCTETQILLYVPSCFLFQVLEMEQLKRKERRGVNGIY